MTNAAADQDVSRVATGVEGLDDVLGGGLPAHRLYLIEGDPGAGKTTLALAYLREGARQGERGLYVTLSETREELLAVARSHGWSLDGIAVYEMAPSEGDLAADSQNTLFHPSELELSDTTQAVLAEVQRARPTRVVFDSLSEMRLLAQNPLRYRRQILALKQFFIGRQCTVLLLDDRTAGDNDLQLQSLAHGVLSLERRSPDYGVMQRRLQVLKLRGQEFRAGFHDFTIQRGGVRVFPRLVAAEHHREFPTAPVGSGIAELDQLLGGGIERGTSTLVLGPAGSGKSSLLTQYAVAAAARQERAALFLFDESLQTLRARAAGLGQELQGPIDAGRVLVRKVDPAELSAGEFANVVRQSVERDGVQIVAIDSLNGFLNAMPDTRYLLLHLHELLTYLSQQGVTSFLTLGQHGLIGTMSAPLDASYLADAVILLRFFEAGGEVRQSLAVIKKRGGLHERTIREMRLGAGGIRIGEPLREFQGLLTGVPTYTGRAGPLIGRGNDRGERESE
jgi:circadian clock protein KaiC